MEENLFNIVPNLEMLLQTKSYEELTGEEADELSKFISIEDYNLLRNTISDVKASFKSDKNMIEPLPEIKERLSNVMLAKQKDISSNRFSTINKIINYRMPIYKVVAAVIILFTVLLFIKSSPVDSIKYINRTDTLYVEKQVNQSDNTKPITSISDNSKVKLNKKERINNIDIKTAKKTSYPMNQYEQLQNTKTMKNIEMTQSMRKGSSIKNDTLLEHLVYVVN